MPKPAQVRLLEGNPSHRPINLADGINPPVELPAPPDWLNDDARAEWARTGGHLLSLGLISQIDAAEFALYCQCFGQLSQLERAFDKAQREAMAADADPIAAAARPFFVKTPTGFDRTAPIVREIQALREQVHKYQQAFGLSPAARMRVQASDGGQLALPGLEPANEEQRLRLANFA